ncbi:MAG: hypothetical protein R2788_24135 [Saprospiraceae bacterium]
MPPISPIWSEGYTAAVEAILNIAKGQMKDALRGLSEYRCEHILGLYNSKGFAGTVEYFVRESAGDGQFDHLNSAKWPMI